jgi:hypothetical protein
MLLLPFAFANVAFWTRLRTARPGGAGRWGEGSEDSLDLGGVAAWFQRLLCLGVTATFALAAVGAGVDIVGWQCHTRECLDKLPFLGFLEVKNAGGSWWSQGTRPLVVGLLAPVAAMLVLWWLARNSFQYEAEVAVRKPGGVEHPTGHQMESRWFWSGEGQVRRLAALHLYRRTDPLGYPVDVTVGRVTVDQLVRDPTALRPDPGKVADPRIENHSSYQK